MMSARVRAPYEYHSMVGRRADDYACALESAPNERMINCATCHRGKTDPHVAQP